MVSPITIFLSSAYLLLGTGHSYASAASLDVKSTSGILRGVADSNGIEKWLGVPFAQPPVGALRFKAPVPIVSTSNAVKDASKFGNACPQPPSDSLGAPIAEDCLFLNIFRAQGTTNQSELPVLVWIHGGAWTNGASSDPSTDPTRIIQRSVHNKKPLVFVSINYRVNTFGFLASATALPQDLNAGLLDQRAALTFIKNNIKAFGGDPSKVTIWGQSAGAGAVEAHFVYPAAEPLFRAGIADSTTGPFKNSPPASTYDKPGKPFSRLLAATGCPAGATAIACLQKVPFETLLNISNTFIDNTLNNQLWEPAIGPAGSFATARASKRIQQGQFLRLPFLAGSNINEGTTFSDSVRNLGLHGAAETAAFDNYIEHLLIDNSTLPRTLLTRFEKMWPANDPALGAPFNTGDSLFDRVENWYTDQMFLTPRRFFFDHASGVMPMFAYYFQQFIPGTDPALGVFHASDLKFLFGNPVPDTIDINFANQFLDFYINFVNDLSPGAPWPRFTPSTKQVLQLIQKNVTSIPDTWDLDKTTFLSSQAVLDAFEK